MEISAQKEAVIRVLVGIGDITALLTKRLAFSFPITSLWAGHQFSKIDREGYIVNKSVTRLKT